MPLSQQAAAYVDGKKGWRFFFFALAFCGVAGLSVRLYFNPNRIRAWLDEALASQGAAIGLNFQGARLELARGAVPEFAVLIRDVEATPAGDCGLEPSIRIAKLRVPLSFQALLRGRAAVGIVSAEGLRIDLDGLKKHCPHHALHESKAEAKARTEATAPTQDPTAQAQPAPWWKAEPIAGLAEVVGGFEFSSVEVQFEDQTKKVYLESLRVDPGSSPGEIRLAAALVIPPELTFGEKTPPLEITVKALPTDAEVEVRARLSEGKLLATGHLTPAPHGALQSELRLALDNVPVSTLAPLLEKAGVVDKGFHPKFMWMACTADIQGKFQGLFAENPLRLSGCRIEGNGATVKLSQAVRMPNGKWSPFSVTMEKLDLGQTFEMFGWQGPVGVFSDFGRLSGELAVRGEREAEFNSTIEGAQLRISNRSQRAEQPVRSMKLRLALNHEEAEGTLRDIDLEGGAFKGGLEFRLRNHLRDGEAKLEVKSLRLRDEAYAVLFGGKLADVNGQAEARFSTGKLTSLKGAFSFEGLSGKDFRFAQAKARTELAKNDVFEIHVEADSLEIHHDSSLMTTLQPAFFAHEFAGEWVPAKHVSVLANLPPSGGLGWTAAKAEFEEGKIKIASSGAFNRDRDLSGWFTADYPLVKKLKWQMAGRTTEPLVSEDAPVFAELKRRRVVDDTVLGLPTARAVSSDASKHESAPAGLKAFGEKVMRKARGFLPNGFDSETEGETQSASHAKPDGSAPEVGPSTPSVSQ